MKHRAPVLAVVCVGLLGFGCGGDPVEPNRSSAVDVRPQFSVVPTVGVTPTSARILNIGSCLTYSAYGSGFTLTPTFDWESSNPRVATVTWSGEGTTARVCAVSEGFTSIRATGYCCLASGHITSQPAYLEVGQPVRSVLVQPSSSIVKLGATTQLTFAAVDQYGTRSTRFTPAWASLNPAIATVSAAGLVTGRGVGRTSITARINGVTGTATVTVGVASVTISGPGQISRAGKYTWTAMVNPSGTYNYNWRVLTHGNGVNTMYSGNPLTLPVSASTGSLTLWVTVSANGLSLGSGSKIVQNSIAGACGGRKCPAQ